MSRLLKQRHFIFFISSTFHPQHPHLQKKRKRFQPYHDQHHVTLSLICLNKHTPVPFLSNRQGQQACFYGNPHFFYLSVNPQQLVGILEDPLISSAKKQFCLLIKRLSWLSNFTCRLCKECEHAFILPFIMADPVMGGGV